MSQDAAVPAVPARGRVVVVGSINVDLVMTVPRHPLPGETITGNGLARRPGGKGANQALAAAREGAEVTFVGRLGLDAAGSAYAAALREHGVNADHVAFDRDEPTGTAIVVVADSGENAIVVARGSNGTLSPSDVMAAADAIRAADVLVVQFEVPMDAVLEAVRLASAAGTRVIVNPSPWQRVPEEILTVADPLVVNEHEGAGLLGEAVTDEGLRRSGARSVVMTLGAEGAVWVDAASSLHVAPAPLAKGAVVDTTGAGDAFTGALAAALASGASHEEALRRAGAAGTAAVQHEGAQDWEL